MYSIIKSGMASAMHELSVISNNVSNANSNGFKKSLVSFADFAGGLFPYSMQVATTPRIWVSFLVPAVPDSNGVGTLLRCSPVPLRWLVLEK